MLIRPFHAKDAPQLWNVFHQAIHVTAAANYSPAQLAAWAPNTPDMEYWSRRMAGINPFVAIVDDGAEVRRPVAYADVQADGYIDHFFVHPSVGRRGVGSALMRRIHEAAAEQNIAELYSHVSLTARPFFEYWGFAVELAQSVERRGETLNNFLMRKRLPPE